MKLIKFSCSVLAMAAAFLNVSCSKDDPKSRTAPVGGMIATVDKADWNANLTAGVIYDDNITVTAQMADGSQIVLTVKGATKGTYTVSGTVGSVPDNVVSFTPSNASVDNPTYTSTNLQEASVGEIIISEIDETNKKISGSFHSKVKRTVPEDKTIEIASGSFTKVSYTTEAGTDPDNTFSAKINGTSFSATTIGGVESFGTIVLNFSSGGTKALSISIPASTNTDTFSIGYYGDDYFASYTDNGTIYTSTSGTIVITTHDTTNGRIEGTFSFSGELFPSGGGSLSVTDGSFAVSY